MSSNLIDADDAASRADFIHKIRVCLRDAKESKQSLAKIRMGRLAACGQIEGLEQEADELAAIFATIVLKVIRNGS